MYNYEIENKFFYYLNHQRASKIFAQIEIFLKSKKVNGDIAEFGVFKGNSLNRLILLRDFYTKNKKVYAFDTFKIIKTNKKDLDNQKYRKFIKESKNYQLSLLEIKNSLKRKKMYKNVILIKGDVRETLMKTFKKNTKLSFVLLDLDLYEPSAYVLKNIWSKLQKKAIILLDNYRVFKGETKAVNEFVKKNNLKIYRYKLYRNFYYLQKP